MAGCSVMRSGKDSFRVREWLAADADARSPDDPALAQGVSCDEAGCVAQLAGGRYVTLALQPEALADDCARAAVIVTSRQAPADCAALVIDRSATAKTRHHGAAADTQRLCDRRGEAEGIDRPWAPAGADEAAPDISPARPAPANARPVDATPEADTGSED